MSSGSHLEWQSELEAGREQDLCVHKSGFGWEGGGDSWQ